MLYRFEINGMGIYEAVEKDCPHNDIRRKNKPDGSWLPKAGVKFPNAISFWTEFGLQKYTESGLREWHASVVNGQVSILEIAESKISPIYEDEYQVIGQLHNKEVES